MTFDLIGQLLKAFHSIILEIGASILLALSIIRIVQKEIKGMREERKQLKSPDDKALK